MHRPGGGEAHEGTFALRASGAQGPRGVYSDTSSPSCWSPEGCTLRENKTGEAPQHCTGLGETGEACPREAVTVWSLLTPGCLRAPPAVSSVHGGP